ncbi:Nuclear pore complex protein Nup85 [Geodia barretti]|uniref:Nuclear pore complex protein Nup85 n=1 Tax=Geodia barretti TaxID=519541 RepID=A0AA35S9X6_GEOBA|nr:Nuclear pore complex protein Nup85 [Geodia barretti]
MPRPQPKTTISCRLLFFRSCANISKSSEGEMDDSFQRASLYPTTLLVPGLPANCPLLASWSGPQRLVLFPRPTEGARQWAGLAQVSWDAAQWNSITRRLANQSHGYFLSLHEAGREGEGQSLQGSDILLYSRYFRSALHECVLGLRGRGSSSWEHERQAQVFSTMALVWHLVEILFIEVLPAGCLVKQLVEWVTWAGQERDKKRLKEILGHTPPDSHHGYWRMVYRLVLTGRLSEARNLLAHHSAFSAREDVSHNCSRVWTSCWGRLRWSDPPPPSPEESSNGWQQWRREVTARREAGAFLSLRQLQLLSRCAFVNTHLFPQVLSGEEEVFSEPEIVGSCESWYELMVARVLFTTPLVMSSDYDLVYSAEAAMKTFGVVSPEPLDSLLLAALKHSPLEVVYGAKLAEFLIIEYASSLLAHPSLWQVAMDYLSECPTQGRHHMVLHLERIPLTSARKAAKVLQLCRKFQLKELEESVCRVMAMKELRSGRLGAAFSWCLQSQDSVFAAFLAERYFTSYQTLGEFMDLDLLDNLGAAMLISKKLTFLGKYREFHQLFADGEFRPAGQLLVSLLTSGVVPKRFWLTLLMDSLPLLNLKDEIVFSSEDTVALSHCLQQLTSSHSRIDQSQSTSKSHDSEKAPPPDQSSKLSLLRVALCRNLALATLQEAELS